MSKVSIKSLIRVINPLKVSLNEPYLDCPCQTTGLGSVLDAPICT
jgi:hypothetical protein